MLALQEGKNRLVHRNRPTFPVLRTKASNFAHPHAGMQSEFCDLANSISPVANSSHPQALSSKFKHPRAERFLKRLESPIVGLLLELV
jgi:hypothetical protein